jgi:hypothetical protein
VEIIFHFDGFGWDMAIDAKDLEKLGRVCLAPPTHARFEMLKALVA